MGALHPLFAIARIVGWSAHRIGLVCMNKIIRPAYAGVMRGRDKKDSAGFDDPFGNHRDTRCCKDCAKYPRCLKRFSER